jgi:hypothetical protein
MEKLWSEIKGGVEASANVTLDQVDSTAPSERIAIFAGADGFNYRLTLTKVQPTTSTAHPSG